MTPAPSASSDGSRPRRAPLSRILALRLDGTATLLTSIQPSIPGPCYPFPDPSPALSYAEATDDALHPLTARAALACLRAIHALSCPPADRPSSRRSDLDFIGLKDRKTLQTLLTLVSTWGFDAALMGYDSALQIVQGKPPATPGQGQGQGQGRFMEITPESEAADRRAFADAVENLASLFSPTVALLYSRAGAAVFDPESLVASQVLRPDQALASQMLAAAARLCWGPSPSSSCGEGADIQTIKAAHAQARTLIPTLLKR